MAVTLFDEGPRPRTEPVPTKASPGLEDRLQVRRGQVRSLRHLLLLGDLALTLLVAGVAVASSREVAAVTVLAVSLAVAAHVYAADGARSLLAGHPVLYRAALVAAAACVLIAVSESSTPTLGREAVLGAACITVALLGTRVALRLPRVRAHYGLGQRRRLVVGDPQALDNAAVHHSPAVESGEVILVVTRADRAVAASTPVAVRDGEKRRRREEGTGPTGVVERVVRTALDNAAERVTVIPGDSWGRTQLRELSWLLEGTGIDMVIGTNLDGIAPHRVDVLRQDGRLMIKVGSASPSGTHALLKGAVDRAAAAVLLVLVSPALLVIAALIRLDSSGPAIFTQTRVREGGATFRIYKFRTMSTDAEEKLSELQELTEHETDRPLFKFEGDPRVTRVGHLLRKTSLDELPQLLNVLKGEMSLIGPRPAQPIEVDRYDYAERRRLAVKPGMTGLWQVSGRSRLSWDESIGFDLDYIDNWSVATDAAIAVRTFKAVVTKDGAF